MTDLAAHVQHPVEHASKIGMIVKAGAGIVAASVIGATVTVMVANPIGLAVVGAAGLSGAAATATGMVVGAVVTAGVSKAINVSGILSSFGDWISGPIDKLCPSSVAGQIATGSPNIFIGKNRMPLAVTELSEVACSNHSPVQRVAEGSGTVHANQQLVHRKGERSTCDAKTLAGEPTVHVGGPSVAVLPIVSEKPVWLEKAAFILSVGIALCTSDWKSIPSKLACLGMGMGLSYMADSLVGNPVHVGSGAKVEPSDEETDFTVISRCSIAWRRFYNSLDTRDDGPLGPGWSVPYSIQLRLLQPGEHVNVLVGPQGREIPLDEVAPGCSTWNSAEGYGLFCLENGEHVVQDIEGSCFLFGRATGESAQTLALQRVEDIFGNWISLRYASNGALRQMADSAGRLLEFVHSPKHPLRVTEIRICSFDPEEDEQDWRTLATYAYDASGRLAAVSNAMGVVKRRYCYGDSGPGKGLMVLQQRVSGLESRYEWEDFADHPRVTCIRQSNWRQWRFLYDLEQRSTTVTDSLDNRQIWTWDERYNILSHTDALGNVKEQLWDDAGRLVEVLLPNGGRQRFEYDKRGNLCKEIAPDGGVTSRKWHHRLPLLLEESNPAGEKTVWEYDDMGKLIALVDPAGGRSEYCNDEYGQPVMAVNPIGGEYRFLWSRAGQLVRYTNCSGAETRYSYNRDGNPAGIYDALRQTTHMRHDAAGRLEAVHLPPFFTSWSYTWDKADRLVEVKDSLGHIRRRSYTLHGDISQAIDPLDHDVDYHYDVMGNLTSISNENGEDYYFGFNAAYQQTSQTGLDGRTTRYDLDALGMPVAVNYAAGTDAESSIRLDRDILGRLVRKTSAETISSYAYDPLGRVTRIDRRDHEGNPVDAISFAYDALGNLTEEKTTANGQTRILRHSYDPLGNRVQTILPEGRILDFSYCGSGFLGQISTSASPDAEERIISALQRDALYQESLRTQGAAAHAINP